MAKIRGYRVVFEGEDWSIIEDSPNGYIATHVACEAEDEEGVENRENKGRAGIMSWFNNEDDAICYYCSDPVPAEIQALIHLASSF